jgi:cobalt-zinc-cadmium efflux system outer membrane protein
MIRYLIPAVLAAGAVLANGHAQTNPPAARPLTLETSIRLALENNPALRAAHSRVEAAAGRARQAGLWANPELELSAEDWPVSGGGRGFSDAKQTIGVTQTLPFPGKKPLERQMGLAGVKRSAAELALRRTELVRDTKAAFFQVLAAGRSVEIARELALVAESSSAAARKRVEAGAAAYQEQLRAEIVAEQAALELAGLERDLVIARQTLATRIGRPELGDAPLSGTLAERADPALLAVSEEAWLGAHPGAVAARADLDRVQLEQRRADKEPWPDMKMGLAGGRIGETGESIIELRFSFPLPLVDQSRGRKQEAAADVNAADAEWKSVQLELRGEWIRASKRYLTAVAQVDACRERILPKADEALKLVQTGFEQGRLGFMDLLDTQRTVAETRMAGQQKLLEMNIAQAELEALLKPETIERSFNP